MAKVSKMRWKKKLDYRNVFLYVLFQKHTRADSGSLKKEYLSLVAFVCFFVHIPKTDKKKNEK